MACTARHDPVESPRSGTRGALCEAGTILVKPYNTDGLRMIK